MQNSKARFHLLAAVLWLLASPVWVVAVPQNQERSTDSSSTPPVPFDVVIRNVVKRENALIVQLRKYHPLAETYIQDVKSDRELGDVPVKDQYFLGRLDMTNDLADTSLLERPRRMSRFAHQLSLLFRLEYVPLGFAQMIIVDSDFQQKAYKFSLVRKEFLGDVRCIVIDVEPRDRSADGRFLGRIWVEDQGYSIVRFNGSYQRKRNYLHFDSWRLNLGEGLWLPAYVYSEETGDHGLHFRAQTRLWSYNASGGGKDSELTEIVVDEQKSVVDDSERAQDASPIESRRRWTVEAENNVLDGLQRKGLVAPRGEVDKVLQTVINNLIVSNNLDIPYDIRTRVMLTTPLESFTVGHTIVVSRGLLDVLPDEASLAVVLAHELSHILLGHKLDTRYAFDDRMLFPDEETFKQFDFKRDPVDEEAADKRALELLSNSPYKDKLSNAGLFLKQLQARAPELKSLIRPHLGNGMANGQTMRMSALLNGGPPLQTDKLDQLAALPLGGRIKVDPWTDQATLIKTKPVVLVSASEKIPFEISPVFPHLTRFAKDEGHLATSPSTASQ
jgi:hypothetical protein